MDPNPRRYGFPATPNATKPSIIGLASSVERQPRYEEYPRPHLFHPGWRIACLALRFIDLEYNSSTRRVFEIGMCNANGTMTMDCLTSYGSKALHAVTKDNTVVERRMDAIVETSVKQHHCAHGSITAKQVADELRLQALLQETMFVSWHMSPFDLSLFREWLESEGEYGCYLPTLIVFQSFRIFGETLGMSS
jgi:hypothetical protein